jgi:hypothetical protein
VHRFLSALFSLALVSFPAAAQPRPCPAESAEREVILTDAPKEPPAVVYAAAEVPVALVFDAALQKDSAVVVPGADIRPHAFIASALVLTPSKALAAQGSAPMSVPLVDGVVALTLDFKSGRSDRLVRFVRRAAAARSDPTRRELQSALRMAAPTVLGNDSGADAVGHLRDGERGVTQRVVDGFSYLKVRSKTNLECVPTSARLMRGQEPVEVLVAEQAEPCVAGKNCKLMLVVRAPPEEAADYVLEFLAADGAVCEVRSGITLGPKAP